MKPFLLLLLNSLLLVESLANECGSNFQDCFCGIQYFERTKMLVVNCTNTGITDVEVLKNLPEGINMLIFTGNNISTLPANVFGRGEKDYLSSLKIIDMSNNGIHEIKGQAFHHVVNVERLILNHNNISISNEGDIKYHHPRVFSNFDNLKELHLTNAFADNTDTALTNNLHDIFVNSSLPKLYKLHLEQNEIKNFPNKEVFCDLPDLHDLHLGDNNIPSLNFNILCLKRLRYLDIEYNNITQFSLEDLDTFEKVNHQSKFTLNVGGNPLKCDSSIKSFYSWLQNTKVEIRDVRQLQNQCFKSIGNSQHAKISQGLTILLVILVCILLTLLGAYIYLKKDNVRNKLSPLFEAVSRKVQYSAIESQDLV